MGTSLIDNFDYRGRRFLDSRQSAATLGALRAIPESTVPDGFRAHCAETGLWYEFNSANAPDPSTGRWRALPTELAQQTGARPDIPMSQDATTQAIASVKEAIDTIACLDKASQYYQGFYNTQNLNVGDISPDKINVSSNSDFICTKLRLIPGDVLEIVGKGGSALSSLYVVINETGTVIDKAEPGEDTRINPKVVNATESLIVYISINKTLNFSVRISGFIFAPDRMPTHSGNEVSYYAFIADPIKLDTTNRILTIPSGTRIFSSAGNVTVKDDIVCSNEIANLSSGSNSHFIILDVVTLDIRYCAMGQSIILRPTECLIAQCRWAEAIYEANTRFYFRNERRVDCLFPSSSTCYATHVYGTPSVDITDDTIKILPGARFLGKSHDITFQENISLPNNMGGGTGWLVADFATKEVRLVNAVGSDFLSPDELILCLFRFGTGILGGTIESYSLNGETINFLNFSPKSTPSLSESTVIAPCMYNPPLDLKKSQLRVLDIGNSYTEDSTHYLARITQASGIDVSDMCLYKAIRGGASFKNWYDVYHDSDSTSYTVSKILGGLSATIEGNVAANNGERFRNTLISNKWDLIIIHQVSTYAPYFDRWEEDSNAGYLSKFISLIRKHQPQATIGFLLVHSYWSYYPQNTEKSSYKRWEAIADSVKKLRAKYGIDFVIPYGTAIQNIRQSSLNNEYDLTADGTHCADGIADYTAACCYFQSLLAPRYGISILGNTCRISDIGESAYPGITVTDENASICQKAAFLATYNWYQVYNPDETDL